MMTHTQIARETRKNYKITICSHDVLRLSIHFSVCLRVRNKTSSINSGSNEQNEYCVFVSEQNIFLAFRQKIVNRTKGFRFAVAIDFSRRSIHKHTVAVYRVHMQIWHFQFHCIKPNFASLSSLPSLTWFPVRICLPSRGVSTTTTIFSL